MQPCALKQVASYRCLLDQVQLHWKNFISSQSLQHHCSLGGCGSAAAPTHTAPDITVAANTAIPGLEFTPCMEEKVAEASAHKPQCRPVCNSRQFSLTLFMKNFTFLSDKYAIFTGNLLFPQLHDT